MHLFLQRGKTLLIGLLVISLHSSVCTGGVFSVTAALAGHIGASGEPLLFSQDTLLCQLYTPVDESEGSSVDQSPLASGCEDAEFCLQNSARGVREDVPLLSFALSVATVPTAFAQDYESFIGDTVRHGIREGPLYEQSDLLAHVLLKRE